LSTSQVPPSRENVPDVTRWFKVSITADLSQPPPWAPTGNRPARLTKLEEAKVGGTALRRTCCQRSPHTCTSAALIWDTASADDQGIHVTSQVGHVIWLPIPGTPRLPQFQHSLGSAFCWLPFMCLHRPRMPGSQPPWQPRECVYMVESRPRVADTSRGRPVVRARLGQAPGLRRQVPEPCWARNSASGGGSGHERPHTGAGRRRRPSWQRA
jgi:hypothetical protein